MIRFFIKNNIRMEDMYFSWNMLDFKEEYSNPFKSWDKVDDLDKVEFIMNLEKVMKISISDDIGIFMIENGIHYLQSMFRNEKINILLDESI